MVITQTDLIARRREQVYELHWKGKSSREIAKILNCSFKTVCNDIIWLQDHANEEIKEQRKHIALAHQETCDIFRYLLTKALEQFDKAEREGNQDRMERLYSIIESLNANLLSTKATGDLIEREIEHVKQTADTIDKRMERVIGNNNDRWRTGRNKDQRVS